MPSLALTIRIPEHLVPALDQIATAENRSKASAVLNLAVEGLRARARHELPQGADPAQAVSTRKRAA